MILGIQDLEENVLRQGCGNRRPITLFDTISVCGEIKMNKGYGLDDIVGTHPLFTFQVQDQRLRDIQQNTQPI